MEQFEQARNEIAGELTNADQEQAFKARADLAQINHGEGLINHITEQKAIERELIDKASFATDLETMGLNYDNPSMYGQTLASIRQNAERTAKRNGIKGEAKDLMILERLSAAHMTAIQAANSDDKYRVAEEILDIYGKDEMTTEHRIKAAASIEKQGIRVRSQDTVDSLYDQGLNEREGNRWIRDNLKGEDRDAALNRWAGRFAEEKRITAQQETDVLNAALDTYSYGIEDGLGYEKAADLVTEEMIENMGGKNARAFRKMVEADLKGAKRVTDWDMWDEFEERLEAGDITDMAQVRAYMPYLSDRDMRNAKKLFDKRGTLTVTELRNAYIDRVGKSKAKWSKNQQQQWLTFQDYMLNNVKETRRPEDLDVWADRWFMSGENAETFWFTDDPDTLGEAVTEGRGGDFYLDVPDEDELSVRGVMGKAKISNITPEVFYTTQYLPAVDFLRAHKIAINDNSIWAISILNRAKRPVTAANVTTVSADPEGFTELLQ
jgi:hypothetical protein